jgi:hypothetical protein
MAYDQSQHYALVQSGVPNDIAFKMASATASAEEKRLGLIYGGYEPYFAAKIAASTATAAEKELVSTRNHCGQSSVNAKAAL